MDDTDKEDLIDQIIKEVPQEKDRDIIARKLYRHRVVDTGNWEHINKEKMSNMQASLIPQRQAKLDQVINNRINDSWNEPTIIRVIIVNEEHKPASSEIIYDVFVPEGTITTKVVLSPKVKHPENPFNWQFGIDKMLVQQFVEDWTKMERSVIFKSQNLS